MLCLGPPVGPTSDLTSRFVKLGTCLQPVFLGTPQRGFGTGARLAELGSLPGIAREQVRQGKRRVDLGDDAVDARDFGLGYGDPLSQWRSLFAFAALGPCAFLAALAA